MKGRRPSFRRVVRPLLFCFGVLTVAVVPPFVLQQTVLGPKIASPPFDTSATRPIKNPAIRWRTELIYQDPNGFAYYRADLSGAYAVAPDALIAITKSKYPPSSARPATTLSVIDMTVGKLRMTNSSRGTGPSSAVACAANSKLGLIFVATAESSVVAVDDHTFGVAWTAATSAPCSDLAVIDDVVIAGCGRQIQGFEATSGRLLWTHGLRGNLTTTLATPDPVAPRRRLLAFGVSGQENAAQEICALDACTGSIRWRASVPAGLARPVVLSGNSVFCVTRKPAAGDPPVLHALDSSTGAARWHVDVQVRGYLWVETCGGLAADGERIYQTTKEGVICFDRSDGRILWSWPAEFPGMAGAAAPRSDGRFLYLNRVGAYRSRTEGYRSLSDGFGSSAGPAVLDTRTGQERWHCPCSGLTTGAGLFPGLPPLILGDLVIACYSNGTIEAISLSGNVGRLGAGTPLGKAQAIRVQTLLAAGGALLVTLVTAILLRRVRATLAFLSLTLAALTVAAWARSYTMFDFAGTKSFNTGGTFRSEFGQGVWSRCGALSFGLRQLIWDTSLRRQALGDTSARFWWTQRPPLDVGETVAESAPAGLNLFEFALTRTDRPSGTVLGNQRDLTLTVPHWLLAALLAVAPMAWVLGLWRDRPRVPRGHCPSCGYDWRITPGQCPECGHGREPAPGPMAMKPTEERIG